MMARLGILISGGGSNMEAIVRACRSGLLSDLAEPAVVVSNRADARGIARARQLGVHCELLPHGSYASRLDHERALEDVLQHASVDVVVLAGYMRVLSAAGLALLDRPVVNIHPVPTYWYQGGHGYEHLFAQAEAGRVALGFPTVHLVDAGIDTGRVVLYGLPYPLAGLRSLEALRARGLAEEHRLYPLALRHLLRGGPETHSVEHATHTPSTRPELPEASAVAFTAFAQEFLRARTLGLPVGASFHGLPLPEPGQPEPGQPEPGQPEPGQPEPAPKGAP